MKKILDRVVDVQDKLLKIGYPRINIDITITKLKPGLAGVAYSRINKIKISQDYLREFPEQIIERTVAHEVAHLYVAKYIPSAKQAHGPQFKRILRYLGVSDSTYHSMKLVNGPVKITRIKKRYVYITEHSKREINLTTQQHNKVELGRLFFYENERLTFTNKTLEIK